MKVSKVSHEGLLRIHGHAKVMPMTKHAFLTLLASVLFSTTAWAQIAQPDDAKTLPKTTHMVWPLPSNGCRFGYASDCIAITRHARSRLNVLHRDTQWELHCVCD